MKAIKFTILIFGFVHLIFSFESKHDTFEGIIMYKLSVELTENSNIAHDYYVKMMFQDMDTIAMLYLKNNNYKIVTVDAKTNTPKLVTQYDSETNKTYSYMAEQNDVCFFTNINNPIKPLVYENKGDTLILLGKKCHSITIDYPQTSKTVIYFSDEFKINNQRYKDNPIGFLEYIFRTGSLPMKVIISDNKAIQNMVFTATEIKREELEDMEFKVPKFKQLIESPF